MKIKNLLPHVGAILLIVIAFSSCQEDLSTIGSELLGTQTPNGILDDSETVIAYSRKLEPIQTSRLPVYQIGVYNDPIYGKSTVNFLSQVTLESNNPKFGDSAEVDSVFLYIPYFNTPTVTTDTTTYKLDSVYGSSPINITMSQSDYFLREYDPNSGFEKFQNYYTDQGPTFESFLGEEIIKIEDFKPTTEGYVLYEGEEEEETLTPGLRVKLPIEYFQEKIIDMEETPELRNNNNFKNYLRGFYFKVDAPTDNGNLFIFNPNNANITLHYSYDNEDDSEIRENDTFKLNFGGINVNTYENELPQSIITEIENPDIINGNENLYLRGGDGIISVIELFGQDLNANGVADDLETLREKEWLINEANLFFYVNQSQVESGSSEPERIIIYDLENNNVLVDFSTDYTNNLEPIDAINIHLGRLQRDSDGNGDYYKVNITNHISNLINKDSTNVPLGLIVSQNVLVNTTQELVTPQAPDISEVPASAVVSPEGTILYGNATSNQDKRLKLQIYYTEPK